MKLVGHNLKAKLDKMNRRLTEKNCTYCNRQFMAKRSDALYCSHTCNQYAYYERSGKKHKKSDLIKKHEYNAFINMIKECFDKYCVLCSSEEVTIYDILIATSSNNLFLSKDVFIEVYRNSIFKGIIEKINYEYIKVIIKQYGNSKYFIIINQEILQKKELFD